MTNSEQIEEAAATWIVREDQGLSDRERAELETWFEQDIAHRVAYLRLTHAWQKSERLAALKHSPLFAARSAIELHTWRTAAIAAAIIVLAVGAAFSLQYFNRGAVYAAKPGQRPAMHLADGTRVQLNANSQLRSQITNKSRVITLERGEAYFDVAPDDKRPFVVIAGNRRIRDIGTKFSVRRVGNDVQVLVEEGKVQVEPLNNQIGEAPVLAVAGEMVVAKADETLIVSRGEKKVADQLSWRTGFIVFDRVTLAEAAEEFNRYNGRRLIVLGEARNIPIGGRFRIDNVESFSSLLHVSLGLTVERRDNELRVSK